MFYDATNYSLLSSIDLQDDADNLGYDTQQIGYLLGKINCIELRRIKPEAASGSNGIGGNECKALKLQTKTFN